MKILVVNGPSLDRLGQRSPEIYGTTTLAEIQSWLNDDAEALGISVEFLQSADERTLIAAITDHKADGIVINPAAFSHFSYPLADTLRKAEVPVVEIHLTNIHTREHYRRLSVISPVARAVVMGMGAQGYRVAFAACARMLSQS